MEIRGYDERGNFEGFTDRECGEHRTVGAHRAWCHDCHEWCYPGGPCRGCQHTEERMVDAEAKVQELEATLAERDARIKELEADVLETSEVLGHAMVNL